jgi:hypothetical protein
MLSSGERQMIYSVSSILYHLLNLDSIKTTRSRTSYRYVNIILEEIELYFHPEMQRIFINHIIEQIGNIGLNNIVGVNFCFVSHSPFILSDIPKENIMFLKVINNLSTQIKDVQGTFGANIYDLLKDGFFMDNGHIGEFAKRQIDKTISWLNDNLKDLLNHDKDLNNRDSQKDHFRLMIEIVDEPIVKRKLTEMYLELYQDDKEQLILAEIERLSNEIGYKTTSTKKE